MTAAIHRNRESGADLGHSDITQSANSIGKHTYRNAFDRIEIDCSFPAYRIVAWFKDDLARKASDGSGARGNQCSAQSRYGSVA